jgi:hypothetical protein
LSKKQSKQDFFEEARVKLIQLWQKVSGHIEAGNPSFKLREDAIQLKIEQALQSPSKTYHYVLPTQVLAKIIDPSLDARVIQKKHAGTGAFDARSLSKKVIVPFDRENHNVLGGSPEPYVNNPLRVEAVSHEYTASQKNKQDWTALVEVLTWVEENSEQIENVFLAIMSVIYEKLCHQSITYSIPNRISHKQTNRIIENFLRDASGGDRFAAIATALFAIIGKYFYLFDDIDRRHTNAPDAQSGQVMDLDCRKDGQLVMSVELKDRELLLTHLQEKLPSIRNRNVSEGFFLSRGIPDEVNALEDFLQKQHQMGHNIYVFTLADFANIVLALVGERGRTRFLEEVGSTLDRFSELVHRKAWEKLLLEI